MPAGAVENEEYDAVAAGAGLAGEEREGVGEELDARINLSACEGL